MTNIAPAGMDRDQMIRELYEALRPFASHVGKSGSVVTLTLGNDKWTGTLKTEHFQRAFMAVRNAGDYLRAAPSTGSPAEGVERLRAEIGDLKSSVVAFAAPWAVTYARDMGLPDLHLHPTHYDILAKCGARMDDFTRAAPVPATDVEGGGASWVT